MTRTTDSATDSFTTKVALHVARRLRDWRARFRRSWLSRTLDRGRRLLRLAKSRKRQFGIKSGYAHRRDNSFFDDTGNKDEYQREVYELAASELARRGGNSVLDVGCGSAFKLLRSFTKARTLGLDLEPTIATLKKRYPDRAWMICDFSSPPRGSFDVVVCADVIEHIPNPDDLMRFLSQIDFGLLFLSTPERSLVYGYDQSGPPRNRAHCREWTHTELLQYVADWFSVESHQITNQRQATQMLVLSKRHP